MMKSKYRKPKPGDTVVLIEIPPGLLGGLLLRDQEAIAEAVRKPIHLNEHDENGRAELEFRDRNGVIHFIFVKPDFIAHYGQAES